MTNWQANGKKLKNELEFDESFKNYVTVFQIRDNLVWIRIRSGSEDRYLLLTDLDLVPALGAAYFASELQNANRK